VQEAQRLGGAERRRGLRGGQVPLLRVGGQLRGQGGPARVDVRIVQINAV
jgi:hypothetical protein